MALLVFLQRLNLPVILGYLRLLAGHSLNRFLEFVAVVIAVLCRQGVERVLPPHILAAETIGLNRVLLESLRPQPRLDRLPPRNEPDFAPHLTAEAHQPGILRGRLVR